MKDEIKFANFHRNKGHSKRKYVILMTGIIFLAIVKISITMMEIIEIMPTKKTNCQIDWSVSRLLKKIIVKVKFNIHYLENV